MLSQTFCEKNTTVHFTAFVTVIPSGMPSPTLFTVLSPSEVAWPIQAFSEPV